MKHYGIPSPHPHFIDVSFLGSNCDFLLVGSCPCTGNRLQPAPGASMSISGQKVAGHTQEIILAVIISGDTGLSDLFIRLRTYESRRGRFADSSNTLPALPELSQPRNACRILAGSHRGTDLHNRHGSRHGRRRPQSER